MTSADSRQRLASVVEAGDYTGRELAGGKLMLLAHVGQGASGTVYRARHQDLNTTVAVKVLHDDLQVDVDFVRRFKSEALAASRLDHQNLTRVIDFGQEPDGLLYLAMEYLDGTPLREVLAREGRLSVPRAVALVNQMCAGLGHAHSRGIIHRDVKPENLIVTRGQDDDGREVEILKICDFGIAYARGSSREIAGTPEYMAPEQFAGEEPDPRNDVYACGVVLYELLTGEVPIKGTATEIYQRHQLDETNARPSTRAPEIHRRIDWIVVSALARDKNARFANARELRAALRAATEPRVPQPYGETPALPPVRSTISSVPPEWRGTVPPPRASRPEGLEGSASYPSIPRAPNLGALGALAIGATASEPVAVVAPPEPILQELGSTRDPDAFAALAATLGPKLPSMLQQGDGLTTWRLRSVLDVIAAEAPSVGGRSRAPDARRLLASFNDPQLLAPFAAQALDPLDDRGDRPATRLIIAAGTRGAYAVYGARLKDDAPESRERFVAILEQIGVNSLPLIRAGLERLEPSITIKAAASVAEDLLRAVPHAEHEATGAVIARYTQVANVTVASAAIAALPRAWGPRARPVLLDLARAPQEEVSRAALAALRLAP